MKVRKLIELLQEHDQEAEIHVEAGGFVTGVRDDRSPGAMDQYINILTT